MIILEILVAEDLALGGEGSDPIRGDVEFDDEDEAA